MLVLFTEPDEADFDAWIADAAFEPSWGVAADFHYDIISRRIGTGAG